MLRTFFFLVLIPLLFPVFNVASALNNVSSDSLMVEECTLDGLESLIRNGQDTAEVILHVTRDGHAVCLSERNLYARAGIDVNVDQITLATLRYLLPEEEVPTFSTLSKLSVGRISLVAVAGTIPRHLYGPFERSIAVSYYRHNLSDLTLKSGKPIQIDSVRTVAVIASDPDDAFRW